MRTSPHVRELAFLACAAAFALSARAQTSVTVDATKPVRGVDDRMFGVNTAVWDNAFTDPQTLTTLNTVDARFLRYPGGSSSDDFHWQTNTAALEGTNAGSTNFDSFAAYAQATGAQVIITANYGTGTPAEAAAWVAYSKSKNYGFKYWEIGNECYGTWEDDNNSPAHSGPTRIRHPGGPVHPGDEGCRPDDQDRRRRRLERGLLRERQHDFGHGTP